MIHDCVNEDKETCQEIPRKECKIVPEQRCHTITKKIPRRVKMNVCDQCAHCSEANFQYVGYKER